MCCGGTARRAMKVTMTAGGGVALLTHARLRLLVGSFVAIGIALALSLVGDGAAQPRSGQPTGPTAPPAARAIDAVSGMPPVLNVSNLYSKTRPDQLSPVVAAALPRVYVPNLKSNTVYVIDPATLRVVDRFRVGVSPQHVVPSYDLKRLWVTNNAEGRPDGSLTPLDPATGKPGKAVPVDDPYNMYFTPDGRSAIVVAEALKRLDFRDPQTMELQNSVPAPQCAGINHADFSIDGRYAIFTCEYQGSLVKIDLMSRKVISYLRLSKGGMPQDIRISPDGTAFFVAELKAGGVYIIDGDRFTEIGFIKTGVGAHGLYPSRASGRRRSLPRPRTARHR
jgi:YVTN family beta-propeller protein